MNVKVRILYGRCTNARLCYVGSEKHWCEKCPHSDTFLSCGLFTEGCALWEKGEQSMRGI